MKIRIDRFILLVMLFALAAWGVRVGLYAADLSPDPLPLPAPIALEVVAEPPPAAVDPWLAIIPLVIALVLAVTTVWQAKGKSSAEKVRDTLILGIEHGATLAERTGNPEATKWAVRARAINLGVEEILKPRVIELTQFVGHEEHEKRVTLEQKMQLPPPPSAAAP